MKISQYYKQIIIVAALCTLSSCSTMPPTIPTVFNGQQAQNQTVALYLQTPQQKTQYATGVILGTLQNKPPSSPPYNPIHPQPCYVVTANHFLNKNTPNSKLLFSSNNRYFNAIKIIQRMPDIDLAILSFMPLSTPCPSLKISDHAVMGEDIFLYSNFKGQGLSLSKGIFSKFSFFQNEPLYQVQVLAAHGSSGGGIFTVDNQLLALLDSVDFDQGIQGFSYATPAAIIKKVMQDIQQIGYTQAITLGLSLEPTLSNNEMIVTAIHQPYLQTQIQQGDRLLAINGHNIHNLNHLNYIKNTLAVSANIKLLLQRNKQTFTIDLKPETTLLSPNAPAQTCPRDIIKNTNFSDPQNDRLAVR